MEKYVKKIGNAVKEAYHKVSRTPAVGAFNAGYVPAIDLAEMSLDSELVSDYEHNLVDKTFFAVEELENALERKGNISMQLAKNLHFELGDGEGNRIKPKRHTGLDIKSHNIGTSHFGVFGVYRLHSESRDAEGNRVIPRAHTGYDISAAGDVSEVVSGNSFDFLYDRAVDLFYSAKELAEKLRNKQAHTGRDMNGATDVSDLCGGSEPQQRNPEDFNDFL